MSPVRAVEDAREWYDYIICGGGTSGCVLAGRLAEALPASSSSNASILIVEAGPDSRANPLVTMVGGLFQAMGGEMDWSFETVPQEHLNHRVLQLSRGKFLGGSSGFNGTLCIRGCRADYDDWGLQGWTGEDMFRCMKKAETFHGTDWFRAAEGEHGTNGPLHVEPHKLAPISNRVLESMQDQGLPFVDDMFTTGQPAHGCGHVPRTVHEGVRSYSPAFLKGHESEVDIVTNATVDKIVLEQRDGAVVATGVALIDGSRKTKVVKARKQIIVSAGIGSKEELARYKIECIVDSPGVVFVPYEVTQPNLTNDIHVHHKDGFANSQSTYQASRSGFFATFPFGVFALARLDDALASSPLWHDRSAATAGSDRDAANLTPQQAHVEYMHTELYSGHIHGRDVPLDGKHGFEMMTLLFSQQSRGTVTLRSADPHDKPVIDPRYLSDPLDLLMLTEGVRYAHSIVTSGSGTKDIITPGVWMAGPEYAALGPDTTGKDWEAYVRQYSATAHHPAGTCRMGKDDDPMAVVDTKLQVKGVKGLMVADCSIIPSLNGGHTQMPAYAIGEKAAEMLVQA
ncbi:putative GMC oxidoreductase [Cladophialophora carrionii]|uniref:Putative GMC oxidoreductase n=1 Tax=Cladophialophora carrionii TaxID=86049 RepID=A0A1C1C996_9EURO|nr:putative GMC oxidoreductase [Cladophialophora carrionii]